MRTSVANTQRIRGYKSIKCQKTWRRRVQTFRRHFGAPKMHIKVQKALELCKNKKPKSKNIHHNSKNVAKNQQAQQKRVSESRPQAHRKRNKKIVAKIGATYAIREQIRPTIHAEQAFLQLCYKEWRFWRNFGALWVIFAGNLHQIDLFPHSLPQWRRFFWQDISAL